MKKLPVILATSAFVYIASSGMAFADDAKTAAPAPAASKVTKTAKPAAGQAAASMFQTEEQKESYAIGVNIANSITKQMEQMQQQTGFTMDMKILATGLNDGLSGGALKMSKEDITATLQGFGQKMQAKQKELQAAQEAEMKKVGDKNAADGKAYLEANGKKAGVVTTKSGLQYKVLTEGKGPKPKATDTVTVNYRGTLIDGKEFDSSYKRGEPATFAVNSVIPGWTEVLQLMPEGSKWEVTIPSDLAYGPGGAGGDIGPNATLIFEIELLKASSDAAGSKDASKK